MDPGSLQTDTPLLTVTVTPPELASWVVSPAYLAEIDSEPVAVGVLLVEHLLKDPERFRVQVPPGVNVTVPVGVVGYVEVSVTVAAQVVVWTITSVAGLQVTLVLVGCKGTVVTLWGAFLEE